MARTTATCTIYFEDGTEKTFTNVTYSKWNNQRPHNFVVQQYDPNNEGRLQTFHFKRESIKYTLREQDDTPENNFTELPKGQPGLDDESPQSVKIEERGGTTKNFYIIYGAHPDLAYSGQRWVPNIGGHSTAPPFMVRSFGHRKEAEAYSKVCFPGATLE